MNDLEQRIRTVLKDPANLGELADADRVGEVGNSSCGEMLRLWVKFKEEGGRQVIDRATFQSFGCETAIAVASLATELIKGKTAAEALALKTGELSGELGPLPPMKIHCAELVEGALRAALDDKPHRPEAAADHLSSNPQPPPAENSNLLNDFTSAQRPAGARKVILLEDKHPGGSEP